MKKKCTNSKCRKTFTHVIEKGIVVTCPYCGKKYPRIKVEGEERGVYIYSASNWVWTARVLRSNTNLKLKGCADLLHSLPYLVTQEDVLNDDVAALRNLATLLSEVGCDAYFVD